MKHKILTWFVAQCMSKLKAILFKLLLLVVGSEILHQQRNKTQVQVLAQREAQMRMNEFLSIASHDIKTPLTSIKGNIQLMNRKLRLVTNNMLQPEDISSLLADTHSLLERTDQQIVRLTRLVNTLIENARVQGNTIDMLVELCELDKLIIDVVQEHRHIPEERTIHIYLPKESTALVLADTVRVKQVLYHYLSNAHKYSHMAEPIEVRLQSEGRVVRVLVRDKGVGLSPNEQKRIWEQFYRIPSIKVQNGTEVGLGLGLHISRKIIEQHNGKVGVHSVKGEGSTFWFTLPVADMH